MTDPHAQDPAFDDWEHREAARKINALFANQAYVQPVGDGMLRVNFGQVLLDEEPSYHTAIVISAQNAVELGELIYRYGRSLLAPPAPPPIIRSPSAEPSQGNG